MTTMLAKTHFEQTITIVDESQPPFFRLAVELPLGPVDDLPLVAELRRLAALGEQKAAAKLRQRRGAAPFIRLIAEEETVYRAYLPDVASRQAGEWADGRPLPKQLEELILQSDEHALFDDYQIWWSEEPGIPELIVGVIGTPKQRRKQSDKIQYYVLGEWSEEPLLGFAEIVEILSFRRFVATANQTEVREAQHRAVERYNTAWRLGGGTLMLVAAYLVARFLHDDSAVPTAFLLFIWGGGLIFAQLQLWMYGRPFFND